MKILWAKTDFLHPTTRGGQIRTLEMLRQLHRTNEIHYVAFADPDSPEGVARSSEYCSVPHPISFRPVSKRSPAFLAQLASGLFSRAPVAISRYASSAMREKLATLSSGNSFDVKVCDFLAPAVNIPDMHDWVLFQHNVETIIWERHAEQGSTWAHRAYFRLQARRMAQFETKICQSAAHVVAVSAADEQEMRTRFRAPSTSSVDTGVDFEYFAPPSHATRTYDLVFVGSMDWMPNIDGVTWFLTDMLPLIRRAKPDCRIVIAGRKPPPALIAQCRDLSIEVTGTVPDVRPYLWNSAVSIVPLRVGGGTRLKIFESVAAHLPVVSTTIGAEGLLYRNGETILIGDSPEQFAAHCIDLLNHPAKARSIAAEALESAHRRFSWREVTRAFEDTLRSVRAPAAVLQ